MHIALVELGFGPGAYYLCDGFLWLAGFANVYGGFQPGRYANLTLPPQAYFGGGIVAFVIAAIGLIPGPWNWFLSLVNPLP